MQMGVGPSDGTDPMELPSSTLAEDSEMVVISVAMANDFDSIHRAAIFAAVCAAPTAADTAGM